MDARFMVTHALFGADRWSEEELERPGHWRYWRRLPPKGRVGVFEIMLLDDEMRELIMQNASTQVLRAEGRKRGMRTLRQSGLLTLYDGVTTIDEIVRETMLTD